MIISTPTERAALSALMATEIMGWRRCRTFGAPSWPEGWYKDPGDVFVVNINTYDPTTNHSTPSIKEHQ